MNEPGEGSRSAAEREGIVDQQGAALAAMQAGDDDQGDRENTELDADADDDHDHSNEAVNPSRPPAEGGREEVDDA